METLGEIPIDHDDDSSRNSGNNVHSLATWNGARDASAVSDLAQRSEIARNREP